MAIFDPNNIPAISLFDDIIRPDPALCAALKKIGSATRPNGRAAGCKRAKRRRRPKWASSTAAARIARCVRSENREPIERRMSSMLRSILLSVIPTTS